MISLPILRSWWLQGKRWLTEQFHPTFRFKSYIGNFAVATPVVSAVRLKPKWVERQEGEVRFRDCPGMQDYAQAGYLITAPFDIHIKANSEGVVVEVDSSGVDPRFLLPKPFNPKVVQGFMEREGVSEEIWKIP